MAETAGAAPSEAELRREILAYLAEHNVMTIATVCEGVPQAAAVFYANDGFTFYFLSEPTSRHSANLEALPQVALTIHEDYKDWRQIKGVQAEGLAQRLTSKAAQAKAMLVYLKKYPFVRQMLFSPLGVSKEVARRTANVRPYRVVAHRVWWTDNTKGFGQRRELVLSPEEADAVTPGVEA